MMWCLASHIQYPLYHLAGVVFPLEITTHPQDVATAVGAVASFTCGATGAPSITYQWFHNNAAIPSANTSTYTFTVTSFSSFGSYHCNATSGSDEVASDSATLTGMTCIKSLHDGCVHINSVAMHASTS